MWHIYSTSLYIYSINIAPAKGYALVVVRASWFSPFRNRYWSFVSQVRRRLLFSHTSCFISYMTSYIFAVAAAISSMLNLYIAGTFFHFLNYFFYSSSRWQSCYRNSVFFPHFLFSPFSTSIQCFSGMYCKCPRNTLLLSSLDD